MVVKGYFTFSKSSEQEIHYQMSFSVIPRILYFGEGFQRLYTEYSQHTLNRTDSVNLHMDFRH